MQATESYFQLITDEVAEPVRARWSSRYQDIRDYRTCVQAQSRYPKHPLPSGSTLQQVLEHIVSAASATQQDITSDILDIARRHKIQLSVQPVQRWPPMAAVDQQQLLKHQSQAATHHQSQAVSPHHQSQVSPHHQPQASVHYQSQAPVHQSQAPVHQSQVPMHHQSQVPVLLGSQALMHRSQQHRPSTAHPTRMLLMASPPPPSPSFRLPAAASIPQRLPPPQSQPTQPPQELASTMQQLYDAFSSANIPLLNANATHVDHNILNYSSASVSDATQGGDSTIGYPPYSASTESENMIDRVLKDQELQS